VAVNDFTVNGKINTVFAGIVILVTTVPSCSVTDMEPLDAPVVTNNPRCGETVLADGVIPNIFIYDAGVTIFI